MNNIFAKVLASIGAASPTQAAQLASQFIAPTIERHCSQGQCFYEGDFSANLQHFARDNLLLSHWSVSNVHASYGDFYTKAAAKLEMEDNCGNEYEEVSEFVFYCGNPNFPGKLTQLHIVRTEPEFKEFQAKVIACAMSGNGGKPIPNFPRAMSVGELRGSATNEIETHLNKYPIF